MQSSWESAKRNHTEACRTRIENDTSMTEEVREQLDKAKGRMNQRTHDRTATDVGPELVETPNTGGAAGPSDQQVRDAEENRPAGMKTDDSDKAIVEQHFELCVGSQTRG